MKMTVFSRNCKVGYIWEKCKKGENGPIFPFLYEHTKK